MLVTSAARPPVLLTDLYQLTMTYAFWKSGKHNDRAVFEAFYRTPPFKGQFAIFAGLADFLDFVSGFRFSDEDIAYLKESPLKGCNPAFFEWLRTVDARDVKIYAFREGSLIFPREPVIRIEGPLAVVQILEL